MGLDTFIRDRQEHVEKTIRPALARGEIVILDRYFYSTIAYQGARGAPWEWLDRQMRIRAPVPDMVFVLDVDPVVSLQRIEVGRGENPNEFERVDGLSAARVIFQRLCEIDPVLYKVDGSMSPEAVHATALGAFIRGPLLVKRCAKEYGCDDPMHCAPRMTGTCDWIRLVGMLVDSVDEDHRGITKSLAAEAWAPSAMAAD